MINPDIIGDDAAMPSPEPAETPATTPASDAEVGGRDGLDPTRYGDWEKNGRCIDF
ncbi:DUF1674 domain-containing protein [Luteimonas cellulosilyticus]|nr:DUF1674 domain-containing protein [Luteimonas cellulosilyticus]